LSSLPTKKIEYNDIYYFTQTNIASGTSFNFLVTNGLPNIIGVLVVPLINTVANGDSGISTLLSGLSTTAGTPDPIRKF
jgi:hypothetical protein